MWKGEFVSDEPGYSGEISQYKVLSVWSDFLLAAYSKI